MILRLKAVSDADPNLPVLATISALLFFLSVVLHEAASHTMRLHLLETFEHLSPRPVIVLPPQDRYG